MSSTLSVKLLSCTLSLVVSIPTPLALLILRGASPCEFGITNFLISPNSILRGWNYVFQWAVVLPLELTVAAITVEYWGAGVSVAVWITGKHQWRVTTLTGINVSQSSS